jgi:hypothetical protein
VDRSLVTGLISWTSKPIQPRILFKNALSGFEGLISPEKEPEF